MKKIFGIFVLLLLMVCNNSRSQGLKKNSEISAIFLFYYNIIHKKHILLNPPCSFHLYR